MLIDLSFYCRACEWCRVHCRDTQTFPVVPRHSLVSCISVPDSMERYKTRLKAPKCLISLITLFLGHPVYGDKYGYIWVYMGIFGYIWVHMDIYIWVHMGI